MIKFFSLVNKFEPNVDLNVWINIIPQCKFLCFKYYWYYLSFEDKKDPAYRYFRIIVIYKNYQREYNFKIWKRLLPCTYQCS